MKAAALQDGLTGVGLGAADAGALAYGAFPQQRLLARLPFPLVKEDLASLLLGAICAAAQRGSRHLVGL
jgi:hypothetical protein